jgi:UDP-N-acetylmuramate dehydrogenase
MISHTVRESLKKINLSTAILENEAMSVHCTFKVGGLARWWFSPTNARDLQKVLRWAVENSVPYLIVGAGANIVPSDRGFDGIVISTESLKSYSRDNNNIKAEAGIAISKLSHFAAEESLSGLDFIYSMPGSLGGAIYMNARCYDGEMSQVVTAVDFLDDDLEFQSKQVSPQDFSYKKSPFTNTDCVILSAELELRPGLRSELFERMYALEADRLRKGHFAAPCAGSVFKNDRSLGAPTGQILDSLGVRGLCKGGACVSPLHANIIQNVANASAEDIRSLMVDLLRRARDERGITFESEILFVGDWTSEELSEIGQNHYHPLI